MNTPPPTRQQFVLLAMTMVAAAALRFFHLGAQPLWLDEATTAHFAERLFLGTYFAEPVHPPLFYLVEYIVVRWLGASETALRFPAAIFGILAVPAAWALARRLFPQQRHAAPAAATLVAASPFLIYLSQEARNYSLLLLLALASTAVFLRFSDAVQEKKGVADPLVLYSLLAVLMLYTHYFAVWVLLAHEAAYWLGERHRVRDWLRARGYVALAFLPWILFVIERPKADALDWVGSVPGRAASALLRDLVGYGIAAPNILRQEQPVSQLLREEGFAVALVALPLLALVLLGAWRLYRAGADTHPRARTLFVIILLLPIAVLIAIAPWVKLLHERAVSFQAPFLFLLAAFGWASLPRVQRALMGVAVAGGMAFALAAYYGAPGELLGYRLQYGREDWRTAAAYVEQAQPDAVVLAPGYLVLAFERYWRVPREQVPVFEVPPTEYHAGWGMEAVERLSREARIALVVSHSGPAEDALIEHFDRTRRRASEEFLSQHSGIRILVYDPRPASAAPP